MTPISNKCEFLVERKDMPWLKRHCSFRHHFRIIVEGKERSVCGIHYRMHKGHRGPLHRYDFEEAPKPSPTI